jgi:hypothetical protein
VALALAPVSCGTAPAYQLVNPSIAAQVPAKLPASALSTSARPTTAPATRPAATPAPRQPSPEPQPTARPPSTAGLEFYFGVWRTRVPGAVWTSPSGYEGYDSQHTNVALAAGDLLIKPDGTYVWNSHGGKSGQWVSGDSEHPLVLIDVVEHKRWSVGVDREHTENIVLSDGDAASYDGRK